MKISKLFHWLYAIIMMLPIFAIGSALLISTFNNQAKQENEIHYKFNTNDIVYNSDLVIGNYYAFDFEEFYKEGILAGDVFQETDSFIWFDNCYLPVDYDLDWPYGFDDYDLDNAFPLYNGLSIVCGLDSDGVDYLTLGLLDTYTKGIDYTLDFQVSFFRRIYGRLFDFSFNSYNINSDLSQYIHICPLDKLPIESVETHNLSAEDVFYNSVDKAISMPLFSWAYNSFLVTPFSYIVALFSMPTNSPIVMLLSYWLAISIIWLVFDLVMYVPLLIHRWLDKGVVE